MATQTVEFIAAGGLTLVAKLFAIINDTVVQVASSVAEETNRKSIYRAIFTDVPAGTYQIIGFSDGLSVAIWEVDLTLTTATFRAYDPINPKAIRVAIGLANADLDTQLDNLYNHVTSQTQPVVLPIFADIPTRITNNTIQVFYDEEVTINLPITDSNGELIDLSGKNLRIVVENILGEDVKVYNSGDIILQSGNVVFTVDNSITSNTGAYKYAVRDVTSKNVILTYGVLDVTYAPESGLDIGNY
jgi:hypothetical protein